MLPSSGHRTNLALHAQHRNEQRHLAQYINWNEAGRKTSRANDKKVQFQTDPEEITILKVESPIKINKSKSNGLTTEAIDIGFLLAKIIACWVFFCIFAYWLTLPQRPSVVFLTEGLLIAEVTIILLFVANSWLLYRAVTSDKMTEDQPNTVTEKQPDGTDLSYAANGEFTVEIPLPEITVSSEDFEFGPENNQESPGSINEMTVQQLKDHITLLEKQNRAYEAQIQSVSNGNNEPIEPYAIATLEEVLERDEKERELVQAATSRQPRSRSPVVQPEIGIGIRRSIRELKTVKRLADTYLAEDLFRKRAGRKKFRFNPLASNPIGSKKNVGSQIQQAKRNAGTQTTMNSTVPPKVPPGTPPSPLCAPTERAAKHYQNEFPPPPNCSRIPSWYMNEGYEARAWDYRTDL